MSKTWVARKACGCVAVLYAADYVTPEEIRDWGRRGYTASLIESEDVKNIPCRCPAHPRVKQDRLFEAQATAAGPREDA